MGDELNAEALRDALEARLWRENYLNERMRDEILLRQILIETEGEVVGQINGLSVVEYPGHPRALGRSIAYYLRGTSRRWRIHGYRA